jgi:TonB family protein
MLLWEPAFNLGNPVSSTNEYSIKFNIKKYEKQCKLRGYDRIVHPHEPVDSSNLVYEVSQIDMAPSPVFPEKGMNLTSFINRNIIYPETAYKQSISGVVKLRFVVEPQGRVSNIKVVEPVSGGCTQEAIRLLQLIKWMPGLKGDFAVRTFMNMQLHFKLPEDSNMQMFESVQMNSN